MPPTSEFVIRRRNSLGGSSVHSGRGVQDADGHFQLGIAKSLRRLSFRAVDIQDPLPHSPGSPRGEVTIEDTSMLPVAYTEPEEKLWWSGKAIGRLKHSLTLWRYVGLGDATDGVLNEFTRSYHSHEYTRIPVEADINLRAPALCFDKDTCVRKFCVKVTDTQAFDAVVLTLIAINTVTMVFSIDGKLTFADSVFLGLFTVEMVLKIGARGFASHRGAYLRSGWNVMDFIIVCSGYLTLLLGLVGAEASNLTPLRLLRVLRPLRAVSRIRGLKIILETIAKAGATLKDVLFLTIFFLILFAVIGVQMWNGLLHQRCFAEVSEGVVPMLPIVGDGKCCDELAGGHSVNNSLTRQYCELDSGQYPSSVVQSDYPSNGSYYFCDSNAIARGQAAVAYNTTQSLFLILNLTSGCATPKGSGTRCDFPVSGISSLNTTCHRDEDQYSMSILTFDNIGSALLLCFKVMSLDDWPVVMKATQDVSGMLAGMFFILLTLVGNYFTVNLILAVLSTIFSEEQDVGEGHRCVKSNEPLMTLTCGTSLGGTWLLHALIVVAPQTVDPRTSAAPDEFEMQLDDQAGEAYEFLKSNNGKNTAPDGQGNANSGLPGSTLYIKEKERIERERARNEPSATRKLVTSPGFNYFMIGATIINVVAMAVDHYGISDGLNTILQYINLICSFVFLVECILKLIGLGPKEYFDYPFNIFDFVLVLVSIVEVSLQISSGGLDGGSSFSALRAFRVFRLAGAVDTLRSLLTTIVRSIKSTIYVGFLLFLFVFIYALLGIVLFRTDSNSGRFDGVRASFSNLAQAMLTVFVVTTGEGWSSIMVAVMEPAFASRWAVALYFMSCFVFGNYILSNLFVAILIDSFSRAAKEGEAGETEDVLIAVQMDVAEDELEEVLGVELDGTTVIAIEPGSAAHEAGVEEGWTVATVDAEPVLTGADIQRAMDEKQAHTESEIRIAINPKPPEVMVTGAVKNDDREFEVPNLNGLYRQYGETDGRPSYRLGTIGEGGGFNMLECCLCNFQCCETQAKMSYSEDKREWHIQVMEDDTVKINANKGAVAPTKGWPFDMNVRFTHRATAEFCELPPIGKRVWVHEAVISRLSSNVFIPVLFDPLSTLSDVKELVKRQLILCPVDAQELRLGIIGAQGSRKVLPDSTTLADIFLGKGLRKIAYTDNLRPSLPGEVQPKIENCLLVDYDNPDATLLNLQMFKRNVGIYVEKNVSDSKTEHIDYIRAIGRRVKVEPEFLRVVDPAGNLREIGYESVAKERPNFYRVHVLPIPVIIGEKITYTRPGISVTREKADVEAIVVADSMVCCPRGFSLETVICEEAGSPAGSPRFEPKTEKSGPGSKSGSEPQEEPSSPTREMFCSVTADPIEVGEVYYKSTCKDFTFVVKAFVRRFFVTVKEVDKPIWHAVPLHYWQYGESIKYHRKVKMDFDAMGQHRFVAYGEADLEEPFLLQC
eukprot:Hpha_TRINITY_DN12141_c0_g1::TRINITY_DN12141_c0_g1_i1::g.81700::m.81700